MQDSKFSKFIHKLFHPEHWQVIRALLIAYDIIAVNLAYFLALLLRFDFKFSTIAPEYISAFLKFAPIYTAFCILIFVLLKLYNSLWRFASYHELLIILLASLITAVFHAAGITLHFQRMPVSYYVFGAFIQLFLVLGIRFSYRFVLLLRGRSAFMEARKKPEGPEEKIMIIGAGSSGQMILRDIRRSPEVTGVVKCFIDDNPNKWNRYIDGIPIVGGRDEILANVRKYEIDKIYLAIPSGSAEQRRDILNICYETDCEIKNLPGMYQFMNDQISVAAMREVNLEDLLGRDPVKVDMTEIYNYLEGKKVLITGGGGSIGSELARQVAGNNPKCLVIFDIYENNAYDIQQELKAKVPELNFHVEIGSVRDSLRLKNVFRKYKPDIVFHAAAHKHVPLMEDSPNEAIKNNVIGTYKTAYAAMMNGTKRFVLISTDKAVNPTNIMGASKRMCEMIIQTFDRKIRDHREEDLPLLKVHHDDDIRFEQPFVIPGEDGAGYKTARTVFSAVRFGNVLGSNGSVIPLFQKQIETTRVVTVTDPEIVRYFMTIPEAVSLVLQSSVYAKGGEISVLDMGSPVKIDTLARNLIRQNGLKPDVDVKIVYTGLRPGEKLYEEKLMAEEGLEKTANDLIYIGQPIAFDTDKFIGSLNGLMDAAYDNDSDIRSKVAELVPTYHPAKL